MRQRDTDKKVRGVFEKVPGSGIFWIQYFDGRGRRRREKVGSKSAAKALVEKRRTAVREGEKLPENFRSVVRVDDLSPAILQDYENQQRKSSAWLERRLRLHVLPFFGKLAADDVGSDDVQSYIERRRQQGAGNASINREFAVLKRMYRLGRAATPPKVRWIPTFPRLKESDPRKGFVEDPQYAKLAKHATELWLRAILAAAYSFGFRENELLSLKVAQVNLAERIITLEIGTTKNNEGRIVSMTGEVYELLRACVEDKAPNDFVFTRKSGQTVEDFRGAWWALCEKAGLGKWVKGEDGKPHWQGLLFHDLRRSAVRNMVRRGVPENVAMRISGHKTRSVFDRYNIVSTADVVEAARKIENGRQMKKRSATRSATAPKSTKRILRQDGGNFKYLQ